MRSEGPPWSFKLYSTHKKPTRRVDWTRRANQVEPLAYVKLLQA